MDSQDILRRPHAATPPSRHDVAHLGRVRKVVDWRGRDAVSFRYDRATGKPVRVTDRLGNHRILEYDGTGNCVRLSRRAGWTVSTEPVRSFSYDRAGRLASVSELGADGAAVRTVAVSRYALGRVVGEEHADGSAVSYAHDALGRLAKVVDENGNEIAFGWDRFGLSSRLTAAGQLTSVKRGPDGLASEVSSSVTGRVDRTVRRESDSLGRVTRIEYAKGEVETFSYDRWGRISERTRGDLSETYRYDHFGRLAEKDENGTVSTYAYDAYGRRTSLRIRHPDGTETAERRAYDRFGRLSEISSFGSSVKYRYDAKGRVSRQTVDGTPIDFAYDRLGRLAGKWLGGRGSPDASVEYEYSPDGRIAARTANGVRQAFEYDARGQLVAVRENGAEVERYAYDRAGNMVRKTVRGKTVEFAFDGANQLVSSTSDGVTTKYAYDAAGRLVREGGRAYRYGYLDKVLSVTEGKRSYTYAYHVDGQLARADYGDGRAEDFAWDGLALVRRGDEWFVNEPHVGGGAPVVSSKGASYFNDMLGTTVGTKSRRRYTAAALTAFGEPIQTSQTFFTGRPQVEGLGRVFLYRNYRASLAKWQTADPLGYPDGWNQLAYCENGVTGALDLFGAHTIANDEFGYTSSLGLGCWYILVAECTGNYENLDITYSITMRNGSLTSFNAPYSHYDERYGMIYDPTATISGFSSATKNLQRRSSKRSEINELTIEFDWIISYTVNMSYQYEAKDPDTGENKVYTGHLSLPVQKSKHVVLHCYHRKME